MICSDINKVQKNEETKIQFKGFRDQTTRLLRICKWDEK